MNSINAQEIFASDNFFEVTSADAVFGYLEITLIPGKYDADVF